MRGTDEVLVSIRCVTYNHEPYIRQCLEGFISQKTNFRYEVIVHDDASTDHTADIIKEYACKYPEIIKPILQTENQYSKGNGVISAIITPYLKGKYVAVCEGDDYWIDTLKLQKQVDIMEANDKIGLSYTKAKQYYQNTGKYGPLCGLSYTGFKDMLCVNPVPTLTAMYRRDILDSYMSEVGQHLNSWKMGDYPLWLWIAAHYEVAYIDDITSVYRVLLNSASHSAIKEKQIQFILSSYEIQLYFAEKYLPELCESLSNKSSYYKSLLLACRKEYVDAIKKFFSVRNKTPFDCIRFAKNLLW